MLEADMIFILGLGLAPILLMAVALGSMSGPKRAPLEWHGPKPRPPSLRPWLPSAEETADSVEKFRVAVERSSMVDFIWERYSKGRALFLDDIRRVAGQRMKRTGTNTKAVIPKWL